MCSEDWLFIATLLPHTRKEKHGTTGPVVREVAHRRSGLRRVTGGVRVSEDAAAWGAIEVPLETLEARAGVGVGGVEIRAEEKTRWSCLIKEADHIRLSRVSGTTGDFTESSAVLLGGAVPIVGAFRTGGQSGRQGKSEGGKHGCIPLGRSRGFALRGVPVEQSGTVFGGSTGFGGDAGWGGGSQPNR